MFDLQSEMAVQRQREMLKEAQQYRLVVEAKAGRERRAHWSSRTLCWLGTSLVATGRWLQSRSGVAPAPASGSSLVFLAGHETTSSRRNGIKPLRKVA